MICPPKIRSTLGSGTGSTVRPSVSSPRVEHGAKLIEFHRQPFHCVRCCDQLELLDLARWCHRQSIHEMPCDGRLLAGQAGGVQVAAKSSADACRLRRSTTNATGTSPNLASGPGTTAAWRTAGCATSRSSMSRAENFSPPRLMTSLIRPVIVTKPASSTTPTSPVREPARVVEGGPVGVGIEVAEHLLGPTHRSSPAHPACQWLRRPSRRPGPRPPVPSRRPSPRADRTDRRGSSPSRSAARSCRTPVPPEFPALRCVPSPRAAPTPPRRRTSAAAAERARREQRRSIPAGTPSPRPNRSPGGA